MKIVHGEIMKIVNLSKIIHIGGIFSEINQRFNQSEQGHSESIHYINHQNILTAIHDEV